MKFGRVAAVEGIDWSLPPVDPRALATLAATEDQGTRPLEVYLGCPVWTAPSWVGDFFAPGTPRRDFLGVYASQLSTVELNSTFYGLPSVETVQRWHDQVPAGFRFCPKLPQALSRAMARGLVNRRLLDAFVERVAALGRRLGPCFLQLPPSFGPGQIVTLDAVLGSVAEGAVALCVEVRHPAMFRDGALIPRLADCLAANGAATVITDCAGRRDVCHATLTATQVMIRFAGNGGGAGDQRRADAWVDRLALWHEAGLRAAYVMVHQPEERGGPELCRYFAGRLNQRLGLSLHLWRSSHQLSLF